MGTLSVVIITYNEERHIAKCLASVKKVADEIIVLDSFSSDKTVDIASAFGAIVYQQSFSGYVSQKNQAMTLATNDYVLSLDADEALNDELIASVIEAKKSFSFKAYKMNRRAFYCGKFINHGSWYPEPKIRLFDRRSLKWSGFDPHDRVIAPKSLKVKSLQGDILHYICETVGEHKTRSANFSTIAAKSLYGAGKKSSWLKIVGSPTWFFLSHYIIRAGFLDGWRGWKIALIQSRYHFEKYRKLASLWKSEG